MAKHHDGRTFSREVLEHYHFRAQELRKNKWSVHEITHTFGLHPDSVSRGFTKMKKKGKESIKRTKAKGRELKLTLTHKTRILEWLKQPATDFWFDTPFWTYRRVQQLIANKCRSPSMFKCVEMAKKVGPGVFNLYKNL